MMRSIWIGIFLVACGHKTKQQKFSEFINDPVNKIKQRIKVGDVTATVTWIPATYRVVTDTMPDKNDSYDYFDIKFDRVNEKKLAKEKILYLDFEIQKDFAMVWGKDSVLPAICQRIQNGYSGSYEYMLAFEGKKVNEEKDFTLVYNDKIFATGIMAFVYRQEDIKKIPILAVK